MDLGLCEGNVKRLQRGREEGGIKIFIVLIIGARGRKGKHKSLQKHHDTGK